MYCFEDECYLAHPYDISNSSFIVCVYLGDGQWQADEIKCPGNTVFYEDMKKCWDVCWTDPGVEEVLG
jgi:hypothetical protein